MNGLPADAEEYAALAIKIKDAYNKKFFNPGTAQYDNNTVTANLLSLRLGLVPDGYEDKYLPMSWRRRKKTVRDMSVPVCLASSI